MPMPGAWIWSLVTEIGSFKLHSEAKKKKAEWTFCYYEEKLDNIRKTALNTVKGLSKVITVFVFFFVFKAPNTIPDHVR